MKTPKLASALHDAVGRYSNQNARSFGPRSVDGARIPLSFAMENMRDCSVADIQQLLKPLFGGVL
jgi:hypothetical protein